MNLERVRAATTAGSDVARASGRRRWRYGPNPGHRVQLRLAELESDVDPEVDAARRRRAPRQMAVSDIFRGLGWRRLKTSSGMMAVEVKRTLLLLIVAATAATQQRANIVFICTDDQGAWTVGSPDYGTEVGVSGIAEESTSSQTHG